MTKDELEVVHDNIASIESAVEKGGKGLQNKKEVSDKLKKELSDLIGLDRKHEERIQEARNCHAWKWWLQVYLVDDILKEIQSKIGPEKSALIRAQNELIRAEGEGAAGGKEKIKNDIEAIHIDLEQIVTEMGAKNDLAKGKSLEVSAINRDLRSITDMSYWLRLCVLRRTCR
jgi:hypothetical protein